MFGLSGRPAQAYRSVGLETSVNSANPHRLISMLFDGAMISVTKAKQALESGQIADKGMAIGKAITIIDSGLRGGLNLHEGGELARNLKDLYSYLIQKLTEANLRNDVRGLDEVYGLLADLKGAWDAISPAAAPTPPAAQPLNNVGRL